MNGDYVDRLLDLDFAELYVMVTGALQDPSSNITVFALAIGLISILVLLVVLVLVAVFAWSGEDEELVEPVPVATAQSAPATASEPSTQPLGDERRPLPWVVTTLLWTLAIAAVWVAGGYVSGRDAICVSCHVDGAAHVARYTDPDYDPHSAVRCVYCHETSNQIASVTLAVPRRGLHLIGTAIRPSAGVGYGVPVANHACAGCHESELAGTFENSERGLLVSHAEPLEQRALCSDCHEKHADTGVVDRYTVGMDPCMRCHNEEAVSAECTLCHTKDVGYAVQARGTFEPRVQVVDISCGGCHSEESCDACHGTRMPHTRDFMAAQHAREAVEDIWYNDGEVCGRCHMPSRRPCTRCHAGTFPTHPPAYMPKGHQNADPYNNGCGSCHDNTAWMVGRNFCGVCHEQYQPSVFTPSTVGP